MQAWERLHTFDNTRSSAMQRLSIADSTPWGLHRLTQLWGLHKSCGQWPETLRMKSEHIVSASPLPHQWQSGPGIHIHPSPRDRRSTSNKHPKKSASDPTHQSEPSDFLKARQHNAVLEPQCFVVRSLRKRAEDAVVPWKQMGGQSLSERGSLKCPKDPVLSAWLDPCKLRATLWKDNKEIQDSVWNDVRYCDDHEQIQDTCVVRRNVPGRSREQGACTLLKWQNQSSWEKQKWRFQWGNHLQTGSCPLPHLTTTG